MRISLLKKIDNAAYLTSFRVFCIPLLNFHSLFPRSFSYTRPQFVYIFCSQTNETRSQDLFQHMQSDDSSTHDAQTLDSATADQAKDQEKANFPDTYSDTEDDDTEMKTALLDDKEELPVSVFFHPRFVFVFFLSEQLIVCHVRYLFLLLLTDCYVLIAHPWDSYGDVID